MSQNFIKTIVLNKTKAVIGFSLFLTIFLTAAAVFGGFFVDIPKVFAEPVTIVAFEPDELEGDEETFDATTNDANLNTSTLSRGTGITPWPLDHGFSARDFTDDGIKADAISNNEYFQTAISAKDNYKTSLSSINFNLRRSSTGPNTYQWQYSLDGFATAGIDVGAEGSLDNRGGNGLAMPQIDLSGVADLQNVAAGATITLRLYAWGASNTNGTFSIGRLAGDDLVFGGNVDLITHILTYTSGVNGSIIGISPQTVNHGDSGAEVMATPNTGYHFVNWSDNSTANPRTDANVTADISVTANFAIDNTGGAGGGGGGGGGGGPAPEPALTISELQFPDIITDTLTLIWTTNFPSSSYIIYSIEGEKHSLDMADNKGSPPRYGYTNATVETDTELKVISHSATITGLNPNVIYYFRTVSRGSLAISGEYKTTTPPPAEAQVTEQIIKTEENINPVNPINSVQSEQPVQSEQTLEIESISLPATSIEATNPAAIEKKPIAVNKIASKPNPFVAGSQAILGNIFGSKIFIFVIIIAAIIALVLYLWRYWIRS